MWRYTSGCRKCLQNSDLFAKKPKGMRSFKVDEFFPDLKLFPSSARFFMKNTEHTTQSAFTDQEIFHLKLMVKVKTQMANYV